MQASLSQLRNDRVLFVQPQLVYVSVTDHLLQCHNVPPSAQKKPKAVPGHMPELKLCEKLTEIYPQRRTVMLFGLSVRFG